jgi:hypothetical protein
MVVSPTGKGSRVESAGACLKIMPLNQYPIDKDDICGKMPVTGWGACRRLRNSFHTFLPPWHVALRQYQSITNQQKKQQLKTMVG